ncbi:LuxR C-terminal-related transcriptional regulator [Streptomyces rectiverticillatus]|uniref:LuxR C-terminal-related transcriptional regulator n=1 Tax=Streptomyces rectiverticillatus TaxID=173860 RepID=UPI001FEC2263|nr:LuxR C-terminal-related transcriptional regulator [Streptomyces rectiverticillatus]
MRYLVDRELRDDDRLRLTRPAHRTYWRRMSRLGVLLHGGSWQEGCGEMLVVKAATRTELQRVLCEDPYVQEHLVLQTRIRALEALVEAAEHARTDTRRAPGEEPEAAPERPGGLGAHGLSAHEWRVARMMLAGLTNRQIAEHFAVSPRAVEQHITRIYRKLSISRRAQLAVAIQGELPRAGELAAIS